MRALAAHTAVLNAGGEIVTAGARQAQFLKLALGRARAQAGEGAWPTPRIVPYDAWLERAARRLAERPALLDARASARLWQRLVADSPSGAGLISARAAAADAERAWQLLAEWCIAPASLDAATPERAAFRDWAREFQSHCRQAGVLGGARRPAFLTARVGEAFAPSGAALPVGFHGFERLTPARRALLQALRASGRECLELSLDGGPALSTAVEPATPRAELELTGEWLGERLAADPTAQLGVIVPDLAAHDGELRRILDDRLAPELKRPGAVDARPYAFAAGRRLADYALIEDAVGVLALGEPVLDVLALGRLLRSPYLAWPGADADATARAVTGARLDAELRRLGTRLVPATALLTAIRGSALGTRAVAESISAVRRLLDGPVRRSAAVWAELWPRALRAAGWPLGRGLGAAEYATAQQLYDTLAGFGALARVLPPLTHAEARAELSAQLAATRFAPDPAAAPVLVLERLEDAALPFDALWVAGLSAERFPGPAAPNPFLAPGLQRAHGMPAASADATLAEAHAALAGWVRSTPELVLSCARQDGDASLMRSALVPTANAPAPPPARGARALDIHRRGGCAPFADRALPAIGPGVPLEGGVRVLERQSECPFKAQAELRLGARALECPGTGLPRLVRGILAHGALAHFWRGLKSQEALRAAGADGRARRAAEAVSAALAEYRGYLPGGPLRALESSWLVRAVLALAERELARTPFEVLDVERDETISLAGHALRVRLDRLDRVDSAETIVIDYKTGRGKPRRWAGPRPDALQLAVYAAFRAEPPQAVAIARLPLALPDKEKFAGVAAREGLLPDVRAVAHASQRELRGRTWTDLLAEWHEVAVRLGTEFAAGVATVDPTPEACAYCQLSSLCRIDERTLGTAAESEGGTAGAGAQSG